MIITLRQLQFIHYYYFAMGIFSLSNAFFIGFGSPFSLIFLAFYGTNSAVAWYMSMVTRKRMKTYVVIQSLGFAIRHVIVTVVTVLATAMVWASGVIPDVGLLNTLLMVNYFVMFMAGMWYVITRTDLTRGLFQIYDDRIFRKSKKFIIKMRYAYHNFFGRQLITEHEIRDYKFGIIKEADENFVSAWKNRKKLQYVLECMGRIEIALARYALSILKETIDDLRREPPSEQNIRLIKQSENEARDEEHDIMEYEKEFYRKSGESEFL